MGQCLWRGRHRRASHTGETSGWRQRVTVWFVAELAFTHRTVPPGFTVKAVSENAPMSNNAVSTNWLSPRRRAAIAASEVRGTFEGLSFLDRGEAHAVRCEDPTMQLAACASIRAEMLLDAGQLDDAFTEANRVFSLTTDGAAVRQARRTCMDVDVSRGNFLAAERLAPLIIDGAPEEERWVAIASRLLLGTIAWEQGRALEAAAVARSAREDALAALASYAPGGAANEVRSPPIASNSPGRSGSATSPRVRARRSLREMSLARQVSPPTPSSWATVAASNAMASRRASCSPMPFSPRVIRCKP